MTKSRGSSGEVLPGGGSRRRPLDARERFYRALDRPRRVLDVGCGTGNNARDLVRLFPEVEVHGIDLLDPSQVAERVIYRTVDLDSTERLPYEDASFDVILVTHVLEHLQRPALLGAEVARLLRPGGACYVEVPNWTSLLVPSLGAAHKGHGPFNFWDDPTHLRPWTRNSLFQFLDRSCQLETREIGARAAPIGFPVYLARLAVASVRRDWRAMRRQVWSLSAWAIYAVGTKPPDAAD